MVGGMLPGLGQSRRLDLLCFSTVLLAPCRRLRTTSECFCRTARRWRSDAGCAMRDGRRSLVLRLVRKPPPTCNDPLNAGEFKDWGTPAERIKRLGVLTKVGDDTQKFGLDSEQSFGVGVASDMAASNAAGCEMSLTLDPSKMTCDSKFCTAKKYLKAEAGAAIATTCKADATKTPPVPEFGNIDTYPGCQQQTTFKKKNAQGAVASTTDNSNKATAGLAPVGSFLSGLRWVARRMKILQY